MPEGEGQVAGSQGSTGNGGQTPPVSGQTGSASASSGWRESIPQEIRGEKSFDVFKGKDWNEVGPVMAKSFVDSQKMIGGSIRLPKQDATPEEKQKFNDEIYTKLGRPGKPEEYQFQRPTFGEGQWDANLEKSFLGLAHKMGLNHGQVQELVNFEANRIQSGLQNNTKAREDNVNKLKTEWGTDFPRRAELSKRAFTQIATEAGILNEAKEFFINSGLGDHPIPLKIFHVVGEMLAESGFIDGRVSGAANADEVKAKIDAMFLDSKHPLNDISHPKHKQAVEEYTNLFQQYNSLK